MTLDEIRKLIEAATPGPWTAEESTEPLGIEDAILTGPTTVHEGCVGERTAFHVMADARFIAAARTLLPALLEVAEAADDHRAALGDHRDPSDCPRTRDRLAGALAALEAIKLP